jgi:hypothetical protein
LVRSPRDGSVFDPFESDCTGRFRILHRKVQNDDLRDRLIFDFCANGQFPSLGLIVDLDSKKRALLIFDRPFARDRPLIRLALARRLQLRIRAELYFTSVEGHRPV